MQQFTSYGIFVYSVHKTFQFNAIIYKKMVLRTTMKDTFLSKLVIKLKHLIFSDDLQVRLCCVNDGVHRTSNSEEQWHLFFTAVCMWPLYTSDWHWIKCNMKSTHLHSKSEGLKTKGWFYCVLMNSPVGSIRVSVVL